MMMKKTHMTILLLLFYAARSIQAQQAMVASGGDATGTTGSVSYTIGQMSYTTDSSTVGSVAQGVQQAFEIQTILGLDISYIHLNCDVYPNPTLGRLILEVSESTCDSLVYHLLDINGKLIATRQIADEKTMIPMDLYPAMVYVLKVLDRNKEIKTFKIIKE